MKKKAAILGTGIMGSSVALLLARNGFSVTLFEKNNQPYSAASRWNEGKIHLGYIYNADPSMQTLRRVLTGGLLFKPLTEEILGCPISPAVNPVDDIYLCHRTSVVDPESMWDYFQKADLLIKNHPDAGKYLDSLVDCKSRKLSIDELRSVSGNEEIVAGFKVPERSISTNWLADRFVERLHNEENITISLNMKVTAVKPINKKAYSDAWIVETGSGPAGEFDYVINALWEGKLEIDNQLGLPMPNEWSHRYRRSVFLRTTTAFELPCAIIATGGFGDIQNYNNRDFYISWYPKGLCLYNTDIIPPAVSPLSAKEEQVSIGEVLSMMETYLPAISQLRDNIESATFNGGWIFAAGQGDISERNATLHKRSDFGITTTGTYYSIDTGKLSTAPWFADNLVKQILSH